MGSAQKDGMSEDFFLENSPFDDPERSRVLWHDVKKTGAMWWLSLESIREGMYGKIPASLEGHVRELRAQTQESVVLFDDLALLAKLRFGLPPPVPEPITEEYVRAMMELMRPIAEVAQVTLEYRQSSKEIVTDPSYVTLLVHNAVLFLVRCAVAGSNISGILEKNGPVVRLRWVLSRRKKDLKNFPHNLASLIHVFSARPDLWQPLRLSAAVLKIVARHCQMKESIKLTKTGIEVSFTLRGKYEKKSITSKNRTHRG